MRIEPYLYFNGNAAEAIAFYERAFGGKAVVAKYSDTAVYDPSYKIPAGTEDYVMHANLKIGDATIMFCDVPSKELECSFSNGVQLMVSLESAEEVKRVFAVLKDGGAVTCEPEKTFWSECFGSVTDKFGVCWLLSYENEQQAAASYGQ